MKAGDVSGFLGRLRAAVHGNGHVGLSEGGGVVRAVAGHSDEPAAGLMLTDEREFVLRCRLGEEIVDAGLGRDCRCRERVIARDHDRLDAHAAELAETLFDAALDDVNVLVRKYLARDVKAGMASGRFRVASLELGFDLVLGAVMMAFTRLGRAPLPPRHAEELTAAPLRAFRAWSLNRGWG